MVDDYFQQYEIIKGTRDLTIEETPGYFLKPRKPMTRKQLVREYLEGETGFPYSRYKEWLGLAQEFLDYAKGRYKITEHQSLLVKSYALYVRQKTGD